MKATEKPFCTALTPSPAARWDLPTPGGPSSSTTSLRRTNSEVANRSIWLVEGVQGLAPRQAGELEAGAHAALLPRLLLPLADQVQESGQTQLFLDGPLQQLRQTLGDPFQAELRQQGAGGVQLALGGSPGGHQLRLPARSTSAA